MPADAYVAIAHYSGARRKLNLGVAPTDYRPAKRPSTSKPVFLPKSRPAGATIQHQRIASYTQTIVISAASNHALLQNGTATLTPANIDDGKNTWFDPAGNQSPLVADAPQPLVWDGRNRLRRVPLVSRNPGENDDHETYQYGGDGKTDSRNREIPHL